MGRLDQHLYPYLAADLAVGVVTEKSALELVEEFFISFNLDSDLFTACGIQCVALRLKGAPPIR